MLYRVMFLHYFILGTPLITALNGILRLINNIYIKNVSKALKKTVLIIWELNAPKNALALIV